MMASMSAFHAVKGDSMTIPLRCGAPRDPEGRIQS
jgi:hypothetical protein